MKTKALLLIGMLMATLPASQGSAKDARPRSTTPSCSLKCPAGYQVKAYTWELHPERTNYDEQGKIQIAEDSLWPIMCALRCELHVVNQEPKVWNGQKEVCKSGADPGPYRGPWRNAGQFGKECASLTSDGCGMHCYAVRRPPPSRARGQAGQAGQAGKTGKTGKK